MDFLTPQVGPETGFEERQFAIGLGPWAETRFLYPRESAQKPGFSQGIQPVIARGDAQTDNLGISRSIPPKQSHR